MLQLFQCFRLRFCRDASGRTPRAVGWLWFILMLGNLWIATGASARAGELQADRVLAWRVALQLERFPAPRNGTGQVEVQAGQVTIYGQWADSDELSAVRRLALQVPGVRSVRLVAQPWPLGPRSSRPSRHHFGSLAALAVVDHRVQASPVGSPGLATAPTPRLETLDILPARPGLPPPSVLPSLPTSPTPIVPDSTTPVDIASTHAAIQALLQQDPRWAGLQYTLNDGLLLLHGRAADYAEVARCKAALRTIPGVRRIRDGQLSAP